jgi:hypothetical protein
LFFHAILQEILGRCFFVGSGGSKRLAKGLDCSSYFLRS